MADRSSVFGRRIEGFWRSSFLLHPGSEQEPIANPWRVGMASTRPRDGHRSCDGRVRLPGVDVGSLRGGSEAGGRGGG